MLGHNVSRIAFAVQILDSHELGRNGFMDAMERCPVRTLYWRRVPLLAILPCMMICTLTTEGELQDEVKDTATSFR
jgi:hypothetical protein